MAIFVDTFSASLDAAVAATASLAAAAASSPTLSDTELMDAHSTLARARRSLDTTAALLAGETARRSSREAGLTGLAQREGFRTAEGLLQHLTGATAHEAGTLIRVGSVVQETLEPGGSPAAPWLTAVGAAVLDGSLSIAGAEAISVGLGHPGPGVDDAALAAAAATLTHGAGDAHADELRQRARAARDELDEAGIRERERTRYAQRSLRRWRKSDGMTRYTWELDPEGAALVDGVLDQITSPRRGGPRWVDAAEAERSKAVERDPRTTDQLASDGFLALLEIALGTNPRHIIGIARPAVRVLVTGSALTNRSGHGHIEGRTEPLSIETVERHACTSGIVPIIFDKHGQAIDVGREQRRFTGRQRVALTARDGGCRWPGCEHPPAWAEAHHIKHWLRDHGDTSLANGILLCRHHHLLLHDNHWEIEHRDGDYWLTPPPTVDPTRRPRPMPSRSAALRDLLGSLNTVPPPGSAPSQATPAPSVTPGTVPDLRAPSTTPPPNGVQRADGSTR